MPMYKPPLRDIDFVLHELIRVQDTLCDIPDYQALTPEFFTSTLNTAAHFCQAELLPLNRQGDEEGCHFDAINRTVTVPAGFKEAYARYRQLGWTALEGNPNYGGQGLPKTVLFPIYEMQHASNVAWAMYPALSQEAYCAIDAIGNAEQKERYLRSLIHGNWLGTLCFTEAHTGTDLGLVKTYAEHYGNENYKITGSKVFISAGEHDLAENIIYLVLARLPGAPPGAKGLSLFIVPKVLHDGQRNAVFCHHLEPKMGLRAHAMADLEFNGAEGYLLGEPHKGLSYIFAMRNSARLGFSTRSLALAEAAYQCARSYTQTRFEVYTGYSAEQLESSFNAVGIAHDIRRLLLTQKAYTEAGRALTAFLALQLDIEAKHPNADARLEAGELVSLLTPVAKAFIADTSYLATRLGMDALGRNAYLRELGMEQLMRDFCIAQVCEGAHQTEAVNLLGRKVLADQGQKLRKFSKMIHHFCIAHRHDTIMRPFIEPLAQLITDISDITMHIGMTALQNRAEIKAAAHDYLRLIGHLTYAWLWAKAAYTVSRKLATGLDEPFYQTKLLTARFYYAKILPEVHTLMLSIRAGTQPLMVPDEVPS